MELRLKLLQTPTKELINLFYAELVERQTAVVKADHAPAGTIDLIVAYLTDKEAIEVAVVQAKHLPEVSKNGTIRVSKTAKLMCHYANTICAGLSDPLVEVSLVPDELFPKCSHMQFKTAPNFSC